MKYVYLLQSLSGSNERYVGVTSNLDERLRARNAGASSHTSKYRDAFLFGSDFPHEVFNAEKCRREIDQLLARDDLGTADKEAVLGGNARRFYRFGA